MLARAVGTLQGAETLEQHAATRARCVAKSVQLEGRQVFLEEMEVPRKL